MSTPAPPRIPLDDDPLLRDIPVRNGHKWLDPAELDSKLGEGGMGAVYRGRHVALKIDVAVKCLKPELVARGEYVEARFRREARLAAKLSHQNLVRLYELRRNHGLSYLILEFVDGETAEERVQRLKRLSETEAVKILLAVARGLSVAHRHREVIVHRDIKPGNILISSRGEVKLADLGLARALDRADNTSFYTEGILGTPKYMAPEQWDPTMTATPMTDVWAMGATLYYLLTGQSAMQGSSANQVMHQVVQKPFPNAGDLRPELSAQLLRIIERCTQKEPIDRYPDASALAVDLQAFLRTSRTALEIGGHVTGRRRKPLWIGAAPALALGVAWLQPWKSENGKSLEAAETRHAGYAGLTLPTVPTPFRVDSVTGCKVPLGWMVEDGTPGVETWAIRVREPRSSCVFVLIPAGDFLMGSPESESDREDHEAQHRVEITRPFYLAETEISQRQLYRPVGSFDLSKIDGEPPAFAVDWYTARTFCIEIGCDLPTEAQWERAARAGGQSRFLWGDSERDGARFANVFDKSVERRIGTPANFTFDDGQSDLADVGLFAPNAFGLKDMTGNLWEWCLDGYRSDYERLSPIDPLEPFGGLHAVIRGGAWNNAPPECRVAKRMGMPKTRVDPDIGFRAALTLH